MTNAVLLHNRLSGKSESTTLSLVPAAVTVLSGLKRKRNKF